MTTASVNFCEGRNYFLRDNGKFITHLTVVSRSERWIHFQRADTGEYFGEYRPMLIKIPLAESIISQDFDVLYSYDYEGSTVELPR